jgi:kynurenine formamidase
VTTTGPLERQVVTVEHVEALGVRFRTWGWWGEDDQRGAANRVTAESVQAALALPRRGAVFSLAMALDRLGPQPGLTKRVNPQHVMLRHGGDIALAGSTGFDFTDDAVYMPLQAGTQWDALCHVFYDGRTYNGRGVASVDSSGAQHNAITNIADKVIGRGVLLDVPRWLGRPFLEDGDAIQSVDLEACAQSQGVEIRPGDFVLVRTGQLGRYRERGDWGQFAAGPAPGLGVSTAELLCGREVVAVATDTWGAEAIPYETADLRAPLHVVLLVNAGIYIGEMWDLDALAADCADDGVYEFLLVAPPLTVTGAVGSPINPLAVK